MTEKRKVVILDDNLVSLMTTEEILQRSGYEVVKMLAPNGCVAKLLYERPDIFLLDISMPHLSLGDLIEELHEAPELDQMVTVLYADIEAETLEQICREKDLNGYFNKTMDQELLPEFLDQFFE